MLGLLGIVVAVAFALVFADVVVVATFFVVAAAIALAGIAIVLVLGVIGWDSGLTQTIAMALGVLAVFAVAYPFGEVAVERSASEQVQHWQRVRSIGLRFASLPHVLAVVVLLAFRVVVCLAMPFALGVVLYIGDAMATNSSVVLADLLIGGEAGAVVGALYFATAPLRRASGGDGSR